MSPVDSGLREGLKRIALKYPTGEHHIWVGFDNRDCITVSAPLYDTMAKNVVLAWGGVCCWKALMVVGPAGPRHHRATAVVMGSGASFALNVRQGPRALSVAWAEPDQVIEMHLQLIRDELILR